jgi:dienelactone hydrolase
MRSTHISGPGDSVRYTTYNTKFDDEEHKIAIVVPGSIGGVKQTIKKLIKGLKLEGFYVELIELHDRYLIDKTTSDLKNINILRRFNSVIYMGSIHWPSHLFSIIM